MKFLIVLVSLCAVASAKYCYDEVNKACKEDNELATHSCTAKYGKVIGSLSYNLQSFANKNIAHNFQYILLSTHLNNYEKNRKGFYKLFKKMSDKTWNDAIDLIKYMAKRGITMDFQSKFEDNFTHPKNSTYELYELQSLSKALDIQKSLANTANELHALAIGDGEIMSHIENTFVHQLRDSVRDLSGHTNDLKNLLHKSDHSLDIYLFDEYLQTLY